MSNVDKRIGVICAKKCPDEPSYCVECIQSEYALVNPTELAKLEKEARVGRAVVKGIDNWIEEIGPDASFLKLKDDTTLGMLAVLEMVVTNAKEAKQL